jgi:pyruvate dehydrogenase E2 component (dihydrolipoamide acetyltransferase)
VSEIVDADPRGEVSSTRLSRTRRTVAERMVESRSTVPEFTLTMTADMGSAMDWLREAKAAVTDGPAPSVNDLMLLAAARALGDQPLANSSYVEGRLDSFERVNVGFAVAVADSLVVPTVFDADKMSVWELAVETRRLATRARDRRLTPAEMSGATFTVSNLGMFGIEHFTAVINSPQAAILSVGAVRPAAVVRGDELAVGKVATLTLNCDHRVIYGADGAPLLAAIVASLEASEKLCGAPTGLGS